MSKLLKKDHSPLKFDTSSANLNCFIRTPSISRKNDSENHSKNYKHKRRVRDEFQKQS